MIEVLFDETERPVDYRFLDVNPSFVKQTGIENAVGKRMREVVPQHEAHWFEIYGHVATTGESIRFENRAEQLNRWYDVYAFRVGEPALVQVGVLFNDITERKQAEAEREELLAREQAARTSAETANASKDEFISILSHELRTPLNAIQGWSALLLRRQPDQATTTRALETIQRNARLQLRLIEDLLDISRITQGQVRLEFRPVDLTPVIQDVLDTVQPAADEKRIQLQPRLAPGPITISADSGRLQQMIWNLLANAVKFTPEEGRVEIRLTCSSSQAQVQVIDTGQGISPEFLPQVFEPFHQGDSTSTRLHGGLGLGLAIVRRLVELHGGTIEADSPGEGQGATFTVSFPLAQDSLESNQDSEESDR